MGSLRSALHAPIALIVVAIVVAAIAGGQFDRPEKTAGSLIGDANCDGTVNRIDAAIVLQFSAGLITSVPCPQNVDVNNDGAINSVDAALILQYVAGLIPWLGAVPTPPATPTPCPPGKVPGFFGGCGTPTPTPTPTPCPTGKVPARGGFGGCLDFSIGVGAQCDSTAGPTKCTFQTGHTFTLDFKLNSIPAASGYGGYDMKITYGAPLSYVTGSLQQTGAGVWPDCVFAVGEIAFTLGDANTGCAIGIGAPDSTYLGALAKLAFQCDSAGLATLTLVNGRNVETNIINDFLSPVFEGDNETLTVNCVPTTPMPMSTPTATPPTGAARC